MSIRGVAEVEREVLTEYLTTGRWTRSFMATVDGAPEVADPGFGRDEICPILFFGQPFDPSKEKDVAALSAYAVRELKGHGLYILDIQDGTWIGQQLPLNLVGTQWLLETLGGPVEVTPQAAVEDGVTVTFDVVGGGEPTFTADVAASFLHGVGFVTLNIAELQAEALDKGRRGSSNAKIALRVMFAVPPSSRKTADVYAAAAAALYRGVMFVSDGSKPEGDLLRDMDDSGILVIRQMTGKDPIQERPNWFADKSGWVWFILPIIFWRQYRLPVLGPQPVTPP